jgi:phosphoribosyl 1,2-cyclic phosphate phosphodiesterase
MKITFLGTSAANAYPEPFCSCENCQKARKLGGQNLRKRSSVLINEDLLIDLGPDVLTSCQQLGISLENVRYCLQTHAHADHLDPSHFFSRSPEFGVVGAPRLNFYASQATLDRAALLLQRIFSPHSFLNPEAGERLNLMLHPIEAFKTYCFGGYQVRTYPANHDASVDPLLYAIREDKSWLFYGTDTAALSEDVWRDFHLQQLKFNVVILDHTYGPDEDSSDHLNAQGVSKHAQRMREEGLLTRDARILATHIAHEGNPIHPELTEFAASHGYEVAFDGLEIGISYS